MRLAISAPLRALVSLCLLAAPLGAQAGDYTLADVVAASQKGLETGVVIHMAESPASPWIVDGPLVVRLLRAHVPAEVISEMTGGLHPSVAERALAEQPGPAWVAGEEAAPVVVGRPVVVDLRDGARATGVLVAITDVNVIMEGADGSVTVLPRERVRSVTGVEAAADPVAVVSGPADPVEAPALPPIPASSGPTAASPSGAPATDPPPIPTGIAPGDGATSASSYRDLISRQAAPPRPEVLSTAHIDAYRQGNQLVWAGLGESVASVAVLVAIGGPSNGGNPGLRGAGVGLAVLGTGSMVTGSLLGRYALTADGYTVTPVPGWIGVGAWGIGVLECVGVAATGGDLQDNPSAATFLGVGGALGLVQVAVNGGQHAREAGLVGSVSPLSVPGGAGLQVSGRF